MGNIRSWGNTISKTISYLPLDDLNQIVLPIGNNNSYGDASIPLDGFSIKNTLPLDDKQFINSQITINEFILNQQKVLYGIPGKNNVTIAGAIASDVHGKDGFWGGSFIKNIESLNISLPSGEVVEATRTKNSELFYTTIGGYGLTGFILGVKFYDNNINFSNSFTKNVKKGEGIQNLLNSFTNEFNLYSVAWVDLINKSYKWILNEYKPNGLNFNLDNKKTLLNPELPISFSFIGSNSFNSMGFVNSLYYKLQKSNRKIKNLYDVYYPLSFITNTKNISKKRRIIQIQFSIPNRSKNKLHELLDLLIFRQTPLLCSIKKLSKNETDLNLSFVQDGWTVAVDFSEINFNKSYLRKFYRELIKHGGKVYLAKDSTLEKEEFLEMYDNFYDWKKIVKKIDPENLFQSQLSKRLDLKNW